MSKSHRSLIRAFAIVALPLILLTGTAQADSFAAALPSVTVSFRDLNLDHPEGVAALYARIHVAAATVCTLSGDAQPSKLAFIVERNKCIDYAVAKAVQTVRNDKVSAYHWQQIGGWSHWSGDIRLADRSYR